MRLAVTGDRNWDEADRYTEVRAAISALMPEFVILGDARGVDTIAKRVCEELCISHRVHYADWNKYGRAAGPKRNGEMLDDGATHLIWFHDDLESSRGTKNCVKQARRRGLPIIVGGGVR